MCLKLADEHPALSCRRDGWTPQRQLAFLDTLARTHCIAKAARAAGMSRESAYRLRARDPHNVVHLTLEPDAFGLPAPRLIIEGP